MSGNPMRTIRWTAPIGEKGSGYAISLLRMSGGVEICKDPHGRYMLTYHGITLKELRLPRPIWTYKETYVGAWELEWELERQIRQRGW